MARVRSRNIRKLFASSYCAEIITTHLHFLPRTLTPDPNAMTKQERTEILKEIGRILIYLTACALLLCSGTALILKAVFGSTDWDSLSLPAMGVISSLLFFVLLL